MAQIPASAESFARTSRGQDHPILEAKRAVRGMNREEMPKRLRPSESVDAARSSSPGAEPLLSVVAIDLAGRKSPGLSVDPSPGELTVFFGRRTAPRYRLREVVQLCMQSPYLQRPLVAAGWVLRAEVTDWGRMYTVKLVDWQGVLSQICLLYTSPSPRDS